MEFWVRGLELWRRNQCALEVSRIVYDSSAGRMCPECERAIAECTCSEGAPTGDGIVRIRREVRNGKPVTVIAGVLLADKELRATAKELKKRCGGGGTVADGVIELQGDHRDLAAAWLTDKGYTVKRAGG